MLEPSHNTGDCVIEESKQAPLKVLGLDSTAPVN